MRRSVLILFLALSPLLFLHPRPARAQLFLSPQIETRGGYTSNRFLDAEEEGSAYGTLAPALHVTWFATDAWEINASLGVTRTEYLRSGFGSLEEWTAGLESYRSGTAADWALDLSAGTYRDSEVEADDSTWLRASPSVLFPLGERWTASLAADLVHTRYEEAADDERDIYGSFRPGLTWSTPGGTTAWLELLAEGNVSDVDSAEYVGAGAAAGADTLLVDVVRVGAWVQWSEREYRDPYPDSSRDRVDKPLHTGVWGSIRPKPWMDLDLSGNWSDQNSDDPLNDYQVWTVVVGVRLRYDWEPSHP